MFKNYLTYTFAQSFLLSCRQLEIDPEKKERLLRSADTMMLHLTRFMHAKDPKDEMRYLFVALTCLRDCKETLDLGLAWAPGDSEAVALCMQYDYVHSRLERLCLQASDTEGGQLRMLG